MKRSSAQRAATKRAWLIVRLRGAWALFAELNSGDGTEACDKELIKLGAAPETERKSR